jgi:hypothetical protein
MADEQALATETEATQSEAPAGNVVFLRGQRYQIDSCKALAGVQVVFLLTKYVKVTKPIVASLAKDPLRTAEGGVDYAQIAFEVLTALGPLAESAPGDLFRMLSLLTGIDQATLEGAEFADLLPLLVAIARVNNLVGFYQAVLQG